MHVAYLMRRLTILGVFVAVALVSAPAFAQPSSWTGPRKKGRKYKVRIDSAPQQAAIYLENESYGIVGYTPWNGRLAKGTWKLILKKDGYELGTRSITVKRSRRVQESFVPLVRKIQKATVEVRADADQNAFNAKVWISGQLQGSVPLTIKLDKGRHLIEVKKEGFKDFSQWIEVDEGTRQTVNPVLKPEKVDKFGNILVQADVNGAEVYVDGNKHPDKTPTMISNVLVGPHVVEVRKSPAMPWRQSVNVEEGKTIKVNAELEATIGGPGGNVQVVTKPDGASVYLDGKKVGVAPIEIKAIKPGQHLLEARKPGYESKEERVKVSAGSAEIVKLTLRKAASAEVGTLKIVSPVPEAEVFVDGEKLGKVPQQKQVASGEHYVVVSKAGYKKYEQKIAVNPGKVLTITAELKAVGAVRFLSNPSGAEVLIDGEPLGNTPMVNEEIASGEHIVTIRRNGYYEFEDAVKVEGGKVKVVNATLKLIDTGPTAEELTSRQKGLTSYGARTLPKGNSTVDFSAGYPYFVTGKITVGAGKVADQFGADAGFMFRSYGSRTELGVTGRMTFVDKYPFSLGAFTNLGFGTNFIDDSQRNSVFMDAGGAISLTGLGAVTVTGRAYLNIYSDRHCPGLNAAGTAYDDSAADAIAICDQYLADLTGMDVDGEGPISAEKKDRIDNILFSEEGDIFDREVGVRLLTSLVIEVAIKQRWNVWLLFEGAPGQSERAAYTDLFASPLPEEDFITYIQLGGTFKF